MSKNDAASTVERAAGKMINIWFALMTAIRDRGGNEGDLLKLDGNQGKEMVREIAGLLVNPTFTLTKMTLFYYLVKLCKFDKVDQTINAAHFSYEYSSFDAALHGESVYLGSAVRSLPDVEKQLHHRKLVVGNAIDLFTWWIMHPKERSSGAYRVALGAHYDGCVITASCTKGVTSLNLRKISGGFDMDDEFIVRPKP